jgi:hypothetical protein
MAEEKPPVAFRLDSDYRTRLKKLGQSHNGMSAGEMARRIVMDYLDDAERERIKERLGGMEESLEVPYNRKLNLDFCNSTWLPVV